MIKTWVPSYSPTQEEFENLLFRSRIHELWALFYRLYAIDFSFTDFLSVCNEEKW